MDVDGLLPRDLRAGVEVTEKADTGGFYLQSVC